MAKTINSELFIEAWERESCSWDVSSIIYKNRYEKAKSRKKLAEQFRIIVFVLVISSWVSHKISLKSFGVGVCIRDFCILIRLWILILVLVSPKSLDHFSSTVEVFINNDLSLYFLFLLISSEATIAVAVFIFKWNLLGLFEHVNRFHLI